MSTLPQLLGPTGLGAGSLRLSPRTAAGRSGKVPAGRPKTVPTQPLKPIPGLYHHAHVEPAPDLVDDIDRRTKEWAFGITMYERGFEKEYDAFVFGYYTCLCYPDYASREHIMAAAKMLAAENAVDDIYCEDLGGSPVGLGYRLCLAQAAFDPLHCTDEYQSAWEARLRQDGPRHGYRSAFEHLNTIASPAQLDRERHDMIRLHLGYLCEAAWEETQTLPTVDEYLTMRQFNNFRPCLTIVDAVAGYELPHDIHDSHHMQRVIALASNATTIVNDLYSYTKEMNGQRPHLNLPYVIELNEHLSREDAYAKAVDIHNQLMHAFEEEGVRAALAYPHPAVSRFITGLSAWVAGDHHWHATNHGRYQLPAWL